MIEVFKAAWGQQDGIACGERATARKHLRLYRQLQRWQQQRKGQQ